MKKDRPPVIGISGYKGSGKTTLIEQLVRILVKQGLAVAAIKHQQEPVRIDQPGTDTFRFYQAGASVLGFDGVSVFTREPITGPHGRQKGFTLDQAIERLGKGYDLILVEGFKGSEIDKIWLLRCGEEHPSGPISNIVEVLPWGDNRLAKALETLQKWLKEKHDIVIQI